MTNHSPAGSYNIDDADRPRWRQDTVRVARFEYLDERGRHAYFSDKGVNLDDEKVFRMCRRNDVAPGEHINPEDYKDELPGVGDVPYVLYHLPELIEAKSFKPVFIVEGEKDVDRLRDEGCVATCNPCGAGMWRDEFSPYLAGRDVVVLPDNDERGRKHAEKVVHSVREYVRRLRVLELPGLAEKGDVSDWLDAGHTIDELCDLIASDAVVDESWERIQDGRSAGTIISGGLVNIRRAIRLSGHEICYDEFARRYLIDGRHLGDAEMTRLWFRVDELFRFRPPRELFFDVAQDMARQNAVHPVREYLDQLSHKGVSRLDNWLVKYCGAEDTEYVRAVGRLMLLAIVRRVREPGCKFDEMVVLEGDQGCGKSSALRILAVNDDWYTDDIPLTANDPKSVIERTSGKWIVESAELKGLRDSEVEHIKAFLSRVKDCARLAYGRMTEEVERQWIVVGTTNAERFLIDKTGNRRFWPVKVGKIDLEALARDRDQLWAEAAEVELKAENLRLDPSLWADAAKEQKARLIENPFKDVLASKLGDMKGRIRNNDVWDLLGVAAERRRQVHCDNMGAAMRELGWEKSYVSHTKTRQYCYLRGHGAEQRAEIVLYRGDDGRFHAIYATQRTPL